MKPDLAGSITLQWAVNTDGFVANVKTSKNTTGSSKLSSCLESIMGRIKFGKPKGGICIVRWPFAFSPGGG